MAEPSEKETPRSPRGDISCDMCEDIMRWQGDGWVCEGCGTFEVDTDDEEKEDPAFDSLHLIW